MQIYADHIFISDRRRAVIGPICRYSDQLPISIRYGHADWDAVYQLGKPFFKKENLLPYCVLFNETGSTTGEVSRKEISTKEPQVIRKPRNLNLQFLEKIFARC